MGGGHSRHRIQVELACGRSIRRITEVADFDFRNGHQEGRDDMDDDNNTKVDNEKKVDKQGSVCGG